MLNRKQLPLIAKLNNIRIDINAVLEHCRVSGLLDDNKYNDIKHSANSKHQAFLVSNEFCKTNFFTETEAQVMEGERYKQLYLTDFDETKASGKVNLHGTNIFERTKRLDAGEMPDFLTETKSIREGDWKIAPIPEALYCRRVEITGPVEAKMVINAFNSGASSGLSLPPKIKRSCLLLNAPSNNRISSAVSGIKVFTFRGLPLGSSATNV
jgi:hypothetical protein